MKIEALKKEVAKLEKAVKLAKPDSGFYHYYKGRLEDVKFQLATGESQCACDEANVP